jgi:hypothetical protein
MGLFPAQAITIRVGQNRAYAHRSIGVSLSSSGMHPPVLCLAQSPESDQPHCPELKFFNSDYISLLFFPGISWRGQSKSQLLHPVVEVVRR